MPEGCLDEKTRRELRLEKFEDRVSFDPDALYSAASIGRYVTVQPTSDELSLLMRLGMLPEGCTKVDYYWNVDDDVHFVEIYSRRYQARDFVIKIGSVWGKMKNSNGYKANFVTMVDYDALSRDIV